MMKPTFTTPTRLRTTNQTTKSIRDLQEQICDHAYELYEQRGRADGCELNDWLQAESFLKRALELWPYVFIAVSIAGLVYVAFNSA